MIARLARPDSAVPRRLAVFADPHVTPTGSGTWKVLHRSESRLRAAVAAANDLGVDATLVLGDLTRHGRPEEYDRVEEILGDLTAPWVAVPGNHDVPKKWDDYAAPTGAEFADRYATGRPPFRFDVGEVSVVGLDSASGDGDLYGTHEGAVTAGQLSRVEATLDDAGASIVTLHHNILPLSAHLDGDFPKPEFYRIAEGDALADLLAAHDVPLVLSGHLHWPATAVRGGLREVIAPAICSFPQAALCLDVGPRGTTIRLLPLAEPRGVAEAYVHAAAGNAHGQAVAACAERGALSSLPLVDERPGCDARTEPADGSGGPGPTRPARSTGDTSGTPEGRR